MLRKLLVMAAVLALAVPAFASVTRDHLNPVDPTGDVQTIIDREDVEFNTCGAMDFAPTGGGAPSGWAYWSVHVYTNNTGFDLCLTEIGAPTCQYSGEPIAMPVDATIALNNNNVFSIADPYTYAWDGLVTFTPLEATDTLPPTVYTPVDFTGESLVLPNGQSMVWGYENAGYMGLAAYSGQVTYGLYLGAWDADSNYGYTAPYQFKGNFCTTATEDASFGAVKSLY
jgi:hypothetical protein